MGQGIRAEGRAGQNLQQKGADMYEERNQGSEFGTRCCGGETVKALVGQEVIRRVQPHICPSSPGEKWGGGESLTRVAALEGERSGQLGEILKR